jgi:23S rRNA (uracil1939-C5)-methyltransferase
VSPDTAESALRCPHETRCGGCSRLGVAPADQLRDKRDALRELLSDTLPDDVPIGIHVPASPPVHTRTKLAWPVRSGAGGRVRIGMFARGSHDLVPIDECQLGDPALTSLQKRTAEILERHGVPGYDEASHRGCVRAFHARFVDGTSELLLGLTTTSLPHRGLEGAARDLWEAAADCVDRHGQPLRPVGVVRSVLDGPSNTLLGSEQHTLLGRDHLVEQIDGLSIRVSFPSFYQSHRGADALLFAPALAMLGPVGPDDRVVDGYGGVGTFGLRLARAGAGRVELVESSPSSVQDARHNAATNRLTNLHVIEAPFGAARLAPDAQAVLVDPPRKGLGPDGVQQVLHLGAPRVLYVSCGPKALARDLVPLLAGGYRVHAVQIADLFPHTDHYETLCLLERARGPVHA